MNYSQGMFLFIVKRILQAIPTLFFVTTLTFILMKSAPGGPFDSEKRVSATVLKQLNEKYHLNDPLYIQYFDYMSNVIQGDFGPSFKYPGRTVNEIIEAGFPVTFELGFYALCVASFIGIGSGIMAALKPNTLYDYIPMSVAMVGICVPALLLGPILMLMFGIQFKWVPVSGWDSASAKILPSITLGFAYAAYIARLSRSGMLEILGQDYIRTARAKGVKEWKIIFKHALRGGLTPVVSFMGPAIAGLLTGSFVVEQVFNIPGVGKSFVQSSFNRDYTMIMGTTIFFATLLTLCNLISDIVQVILNPRLTYK